MLVLAFFSLASALLVAATPASHQYVADNLPPIQSAAFGLYIESSNSTINGSYLFARHSGAAIEQLVIGGKNFTPGYSNVFKFNFTNYNVPYPGVTGSEAGQVVWLLQGVNFNVSSGMRFTYNPFYDDATVEFLPGYGQELYFKVNRLIAAFYTADRNDPVHAVDRFYACETPYAQGTGYNFFSLHWGLGVRAPENPTCQKVQVMRRFVYF